MPLLRSGTHLIIVRTVAEAFSALRGLKANQSRARQIGAAGRELVKTAMSQSGVDGYINEVLHAFGKAQSKAQREGKRQGAALERGLHSVGAGHQSTSGSMTVDSMWLGGFRPARTVKELKSIRGLQLPQSMCPSASHTNSDTFGVSRTLHAAPVAPAVVNYDCPMEISRC